MPEHIVVRCYSCQSFQAQQLRKTNDFVCKMCGAKQSVRKIYARSFKAADIRPIVQEYNMKRGEIEEEATQNTVVQVELRAQRRMNEAEHVQDTPDSTPHKSNEWDQFLEEENESATNDTRQNETGTELVTALPEYKRPSKLGNNNSAQNTNKLSAQPKLSVVTGVKRKWTPSESRDSYESAPKYARHENTARHVSNEGPRLISTAHLARPGANLTPAMTPVKHEAVPGNATNQQHVIDKIRAVTAHRAQNTSMAATVGHVSNIAPSTQSTVKSAVPVPNHNQKRKSEWDDFIDDEPTDETCQDQDGGELLFAADDGLQAVTDEW